MKHWKGVIPLIGFVLIAYWQFFIRGKIPMPGDLMTGAYYPWLDYKWGFPVGVVVKNPVISDVFSQFFPWKYFIVEQLQKGVLPLWNQYSYSGIPLLGSYSSAAFFPFNILLFLPKYSGWGWYIAGQTGAALLGTYLFLGKYSKHTISRLGGAVVFAFSGLMTTWAEFGTGVWAAAMIPFVLFGIDRFVDTKQKRYLFLSTGALSFLYLAGHSQLNVYSSLLIAVYVVYLRWKREISFIALIQIAGFLALSVGLAAIELIPAFSQMSLSVRSAEAYSKTFNYGLTPWHDLIMTFVADFFGNPTTQNFWGDISYHECASFLGTLTIPLILPLFGIVKKENRKIGFWLFLFIISLLLAVDSPLTQFLYRQPWPLLTYSSASRILFLTSLTSGILVCFGLDELMNGNLAYRKKLTLYCLGFLLLIVGALLFIQKSDLKPLHMQIGLRNSVLALLFLTVTAFITKIKRVPPRLVVCILVLFLSFDLIRYFQKYNPFVESRLVFPVTPSISFLQNEPGLFRIGRLNQEVMTPNTWMPYHLSSVEGYDPLGFENYARFFNRVNGNSYYDSVNRYSQLFRPDFTFLEALNVKYYLDVKDTNKTLALKNNLTEVFRDKSVIIYKDSKALNRAYFVSEVQTVDSTKEMAQKLDKSDFNPQTTAIIKSGILIPKLTQGEVQVTEYIDNTVTLHTKNHGTGFLVLADTYDPGWKAYVDNNETTIYEVNGSLRGVLIPQGEHAIIFRYMPTSFTLGTDATIMSLFIIILGGLLYAFSMHRVNNQKSTE